MYGVSSIQIITTSLYGNGLTLRGTRSTQLSGASAVNTGAGGASVLQSVSASAYLVNLDASTGGYVHEIHFEDLVFDGKGLVTDPHARVKGDTSIHGYKKEFKIDPAAANKKVDELIRNTYRTLMSRGMKGCYVYFTNKAAENHFRKALENL